MGAMNSLDQTLKSADQLCITPTQPCAASAPLSEAQAALKNAKELLGQMRRVNDLVRPCRYPAKVKSISALVDYLERHPESCRGKPPGAP